MENGDFKCRKTELKKSYNKPLRPVTYEPSLFQFENVKGDGKYVRVAILDSGVPFHKDIQTDTFKSINYTDSGVLADVYGHATAVTGIIASNGNSGIKGFAPSADLYFAKCLLDGNGEGCFESVIKSLLWCIVREVDIVVMAFGSASLHPGLKDAVKKVNKAGISMFAAAGNYSSKTKDSDYPARFEEVFSVGYNSNISNNEVIYHNKKACGLVLPSQSFETTYTGSKFATMSGSSLCTAVVAGIGVLAFQSLRQRGYNIKNPQILYNEIGRLAVK